MFSILSQYFNFIKRGIIFNSSFVLTLNVFTLYLQKKYNFIIMKKIFIRATIVYLVLLSSTTFAQIKVLKNNSLIQIGKVESVGLYKKDNLYTINYQDINTANLNTYRSISFKNVTDDINNLYKLIQESLTILPDSDLILELPNDILHLHFQKNYGQNTVQIIHFINKNRKYVGKSHFLTKSEIDRIFGK